MTRLIVHLHAVYFFFCTNDVDIALSSTLLRFTNMLRFVYVIFNCLQSICTKWQEIKQSSKWLSAHTAPDIVGIVDFQVYNMQVGPTSSYCQSTTSGNIFIRTEMVSLNYLRLTMFLPDITLDILSIPMRYAKHPTFTKLKTVHDVTHPVLPTNSIGYLNVASSRQLFMPCELISLWTHVNFTIVNLSMS